jgi:serine/threonine-protein kinase HipA
VTGTIEDLRLVEEAEVRKAGRRAGRLARTRDGSEFAYDSDYDGPAVATTLPLGAPPARASAGAVPPFFAGLLPEGRRLAAVRAAIKTSADDDFSLLLATAHDAIGDVQVMPVGWKPTPPSMPEPLESVRFAALMARIVGPEGADRVALPGVQDKISSAMISLPVHLAKGPFILKLNPPGFPHLVENEHFFLAAARDSGVLATGAELVHDRDGQSGLLVRRFDRVPEGRAWRPLAQEDGCQVLGRYPADKYRVSSEDVFAAHTRIAGAPLVCARDLLRQLAFAYLTCNGDAHAKNFSVRQAPDGEWEAAPAYDVPSSHPYGDHSMALAVNGKTREDIGRTDFLTLGAVLGLPTRATARVLDELVDAAPRWLSRLEELPFAVRKVHKLRRAILFRRDRLGTPGS